MPLVHIITMNDTEKGMVVVMIDKRIGKRIKQCRERLGLTQEECALIIENTIEKSKIVWQEEDDMEEGETPDALFPSDSPSGMLNHLIRWGWLMYSTTRQSIRQHSSRMNWAPFRLMLKIAFSK